MIPPTRPSRPHRRADTFAFGSGEAWRPLRLVLDDDTLTPAESTELLAFDHYPEVELTRTAPDTLPRLEIQEPRDDFVPIHTVGDGAGVFWVWHAARLRAGALGAASPSDISEEDAYRALVFAAATEEANADGFVTNRELLRTDGVRQQALVYTPAEAMALIGLWPSRNSAFSRSAAQDIEEVLLCLPGLSQHPSKQSSRSNLRVAMRDGYTVGEPTLNIVFDPQLVVPTARERESVPVKYRAELVEPWGHATKAALVSEAERFEPAKYGCIEKIHVLLLRC